MAFWSADTLRARILADGIIEPQHYDDDNVGRGNYTLHLGEFAYVSPIGAATTPEKRSPIALNDTKNCPIPPGQFGFLTTREKIKVPADAIGFISVRAGYKFRGLVNVSGFHVDPEWDDKLIFAVFNAGSETVTVGIDEPLFHVWFADLDKASTIGRKIGFGGKIPPKIIDGIGDGHVSLQGLSERLELVENKQSVLDKIQGWIVGGLIGVVLTILAFWLSSLSTNKSVADKILIPTVEATEVANQGSKVDNGDASVDALDSVPPPK